MALFLVQKDGKGKTFGVYHVVGDQQTAYKAKDMQFLIWNGKEWELVFPNEYAPVELDNIFEGEHGDS